jgi:hypothetical protein
MGVSMRPRSILQEPINPSHSQEDIIQSGLGFDYMDALLYSLLSPLRGMLLEEKRVHE